MKFPLKFEPETETQKARIIDADGIIVAFLSADKALWGKDKHPLKQLFDLCSLLQEVYEELEPDDTERLSKTTFGKLWSYFNENIQDKSKDIL